jgi:hypothetical protein
MVIWSGQAAAAPAQKAPKKRAPRKFNKAYQQRWHDKLSVEAKLALKLKRNKNFREGMAKKRKLAKEAKEAARLAASGGAASSEGAA